MNALIEDDWGRPVVLTDDEGRLRAAFSFNEDED